MLFNDTSSAVAWIRRMAVMLCALAALGTTGARAQSLTVVSPNGGESFIAGVSTVTVTWSESGLDPDDEIEVEYTVDGSQWRRITRVAPGVRSASWTPDRPGSSGRVRVTSKETDASDQSDGTFTVAEDPAEATIVIAPNGGEIWRAGSTQTISWQVPADAIDVLLELSTNGGGSWTEIATVAATTTQYQWTIPTTLSSSDITTAMIRVSVAEAVDHFDVSDAPFTIQARPRAALTVVAPNGGERFRADSTTTVRWTAQNADEDGPDARVEYSADSGRTWHLIATEDLANGQHGWTVPNRPTRHALVRVITVDGAIGDTSNAFFEIIGRDSATPPPPPPPDSSRTDSIRIGEPRGGEIWNKGEYQRIVWTTSVTADSVEVTALVRGAADAVTAMRIALVPAVNGAVTWIVPTLADSVSRVRIVARLVRTGVADTSGIVEVRSRAVVAGVDAGASAGAALRLFPNPATDRVEVRLDGVRDGVARLFTSDGRLVRTAALDEGAATLALDGLTAGSYLLEVSGGGERRVSTVVVR